MKNLKSLDPKITGHSIRNIQIKHMLMHVNPKDYYPYDETKDASRYVCISCCLPTPEKSTWKLEEVTCKNCLRDLKTILHRKDWKGRTPVIYNSELYEESPDGLFAELELCNDCDDNLCSYPITECPYEKLIHKMYNGMHDCPECGGEKEWFNTFPVPNNVVDAMFNPATINFITLWKCKVCGNVW